MEIILLKHSSYYTSIVTKSRVNSGRDYIVSSGRRRIGTHSLLSECFARVSQYILIGNRGDSYISVATIAGISSINAHY
eukprot:scaffold4267_cov168-Amphora_coffeaeformis.AAC.2